MNAFILSKKFGGELKKKNHIKFRISLINSLIREAADAPKPVPRGHNRWIRSPHWPSFLCFFNSPCNNYVLGAEVGKRMQCSFHDTPLYAARVTLKNDITLPANSQLIADEVTDQSWRENNVFTHEARRGKDKI